MNLPSNDDVYEDLAILFSAYDIKFTNNEKLILQSNDILSQQKLYHSK